MVDFAANVIERSLNDPFYNVTSLIAGPQKMSVRADARSPADQRCRFELNLSAEHRLALTQSWEDGGNLRILLRAYKNNFSPQPGYGTEGRHQWPKGTTIKINRDTVAPEILKQRKEITNSTMSKWKGECEPLDISGWCRSGSHFVIDVSCKDTDQYAFVVQVVKIVSVDQVLSDILSQPRMSYADALEPVKAYFGAEEGSDSKVNSIVITMSRDLGSYNCTGKGITVHPFTLF